MRHWLGTNDNDRLARLAGLLYLSTIPTTGAWYGIGSSLLGGDTVTLANLQAGRGLLVLFGGPFYVLAFVGPVLDPGYASSQLGGLVGVVTGFPEVIGELGTALWLTVRGAARLRPGAALAV
jgi:hypothetical protein